MIYSEQVKMHDFYAVSSLIVFTIEKTNDKQPNRINEPCCNMAEPSQPFSNRL